MGTFLHCCRGWLWPCLVLMTTGCALWERDFSFRDLASVEGVPTRPAKPAPPAWIGALQRELEAGTWRPDPHGSVLRETDRLLVPDPEQGEPHFFPWRWMFVPKEVVVKAEPTAEGQVSALKTDDPAGSRSDSPFGWLFVSNGESLPPTPEQRLAVRQALRELARRDDSAGWAAVVLWAREFPEDAREQLDPLAGVWLREEQGPKHDGESRADAAAANNPPSQSPTSTPRPPVHLRCAAAEVWCRLCGRMPGDPQTRLSPAAQLLTEFPPPDLRATLVRGIAESVAPSAIPGLNESFTRNTQGPAAPLHWRRTAMEACVIAAVNQRMTTGDLKYDSGRWPSTAWNCRYDPDPFVRELFGRWLCIARHPEALAIVRAQALDVELSVKNSALLSLAWYDTPETRELLHSVCKKDGELRRALAIQSLASLSWSEVEPHFRDESARVRQTIAREAARFPQRNTALQLREYLQDRNLDVQATTVKTLAGWPMDWSVPLLLHGLQYGALVTRQACLPLLNERLGTHGYFPMEGTLAEREAAAVALTQAAGWQPEQSIWIAATPAVDERPAGDQRDTWLGELEAWAATTPRSAAALDWEERWQRITSPAARREFLAVIEEATGPSLAGRGLPTSFAGRVFDELLPKLHPAYHALAELHQADPAARRFAARQLQVTAEQQSLTPTMLRRLRERLLQEQDRGVWQGAIQAIMADGTAAAAQIALLAINQSWPDIRQLGCQWIAAHPEPEYALWLLPLFQDENRTVQLTAVRIVGKCQDPRVIDGLPGSDPSGLRRLLTSPDYELRLAVVTSMASLNDEQACEELLRLAADPQPSYRERAVRAMAESGQLRFVDPLIRLGWTEQTEPMKQLILTELERLVPQEWQPELPAATIGDVRSRREQLQQRLAAWVAWQQQRPPLPTF